MISLIIPTTSKNKNYTDALLQNIDELYPNRDEVEVIVEVNDDVTLGINYNNAVAKAKGDKIILLHNDMLLSPGFIETMDKHIVKGRITTYTRVEPPIYPDTYPGKVLVECGRDLETFDKEKFNSLSYEEGLIDGGSQLFFGCMKEDYIGIDGYTFKMFCEDDDLHLRYKLAGFEHKVSSAHVYHFVSKTSRATNTQDIEYGSNRNFVRKWGFRQSKHFQKYNIAFVVEHCNLEMMAALEPWCDRIYTDDEMGVLFAYYYEQEHKLTNYDLEKRILTTKYNYPLGENDIIVEFNGRDLTQDSFNILQQLSDIITESGEVGTFELDIFKITINKIESFSKDLIFISKQ
jgi:GT2 family glycosyltransferase